MSNSPSNTTASRASTGLSKEDTRGSASISTGNHGDISATSLQPQRGGDYKINHRRGLSLRSYPKDCPPLVVQWFFAVDVPKRKPKILGGAPVNEKEEVKTQPKKYAPFSQHDSKAIEAAFQSVTEDEDSKQGGKTAKLGLDSGSESVSHKRRSYVREEGDSFSLKVPVNEDYLFDVDIQQRELEPAYWLGPVYEVKRGSWFHQEGGVQRPADENLAHQLEEGYLKTAPWRFPPPRSASQSRVPVSQSGGRPKSMVEATRPSASTPGSPRLTPSGAEADHSADAKGSPTEPRARELSDAHNNTHRLFGPYSNSVVTYQDATTAYILTDDFMSRMSSTVYGRFAGGSHFAGMKVTRGYVDTAKKAEVKDDKTENNKKDVKDEKEDSQPKVPSPEGEEGDQPSISVTGPASEQKRRTLERHMSSLVGSATAQDAAQQEEEVRQRAEREILDDYKDIEGDDQNRPIEHLLLVTHGIGQRLGLRLETVNFVHDVNSLRKTLKAVYSNSPDLQALNAEVDSLPKNCRVQVLPINWRHKLDFPRTSLKHNKKELDLSDVFDDDEYPNLENITVDGVPAVRGLITDLALDILLYQSPIYRDHITKIVVEECNRIYRLFSQRSPNFNGKVSLVGHSLGSALLFDILCQQGPESKLSGSSVSKKKGSQDVQLDFKVEDFYALGSPIGLFQMLQGRTIAARKVVSEATPRDEASGDISLDSPSSKGHRSEGASATDLHISAPKCKQIFNIFHPTDPIGYRIEPLISPAMSTLKPQPLPYTKRGIFGANMSQGLSGIGTRVGQSVSGFWSSFSSGIASSLLNRSLGISAEDEGKMRAQAAATKSSAPLGLSNHNEAGNNAALRDGKRPMSQAAGDMTQADLSHAVVKPGEDGEHPPTLLDAELETLYAGFQRRRESVQSDGGTVMGHNDEWEEAEKRAKKLKQEELKVRALNSNGRVDYSIQEGAFDISLIAAVASHLSYWADEDVSHFIISQLLSRQRVLKRT